MNTNAALEEALIHHQGGRLPQAEQIYQQILEVEPTNADAWHLLGVIAQQTGDDDTAVAKISRAIELDGSPSAYHNNLGNALRSQGKWEQAGTCYRRALELDPDFADAYNNLGVFYKEQDQLPEALAAYRQALKINPHFVEALNNLGNVLQLQDEYAQAIETYRQALAVDHRFAAAHKNLADVLVTEKQHEEALAEYRRAIKLRPNYAEAFNNLGVLLSERGELSAAELCFQQAIAANPKYVAALANLGNLQHKLGEFESAVVSYQRVLAINPDHLETYIGLGNTLQAQERLTEAVTSYQQALRCDPENVTAANNLANVQQKLGRTAEAAAGYRKALTFDPTQATAYRQLAFSAEGALSESEIQQVRQLINDRQMSDEQKMHLNFALGKSLADLKQDDESFTYLKEANKLKRNSFIYSLTEDENDFQAIKSVFSEEWLGKNMGSGNPDVSPVFIVGMPRSGTTLTEQILAAHPLVHGAGELEHLPRIITELVPQLTGQPFPEGITQLSGADWSDLGTRYLDCLPRLPGEAKYITDKMPHNFLHVGLIHLILPQAKVIHCRRDPVDTCLSCYKNYFAGTHKFAYDLTELGEYYRFYESLMSHWRRLLPDFMLEVHYEELVTDCAGQTRRLLDFCSLPWDEQCLSFHQSDRPVATASTAQVRRPLYRSSIGLWKKHEKHLGPLLGALKGRLPQDVVPQEETTPVICQ